MTIANVDRMLITLLKILLIYIYSYLKIFHDNNIIPSILLFCLIWLLCKINCFPNKHIPVLPQLRITILQKHLLLAQKQQHQKGSFASIHRFPSTSEIRFDIIYVWYNAWDSVYLARSLRDWWADAWKKLLRWRGGDSKDGGRFTVCAPIASETSPAAWWWRVLVLVFLGQYTRRQVCFDGGELLRIRDCTRMCFGGLLVVEGFFWAFSCV